MSKKEELKQYLFVIKQLVTREIKRKYSRSYLGIVWSVLNPLLTMLVMSMIFTTIFKRTIDNYPIYFLTGSILWQFFTGATNAAMTSIVDNKSMLTRIKFPKVIFPMARVSAAFINLCYTFIAYIFMMLIFGIKPSITMIVLPVIIVTLTMFSLGLGYILAVIYTFFGDIQHLYTIVLTLWMYCSALFYPIESVPEVMQIIIAHNPMYNYIAVMRDCMMYETWPNSVQWIQMIVWGVGLYMLGLYIFKKFESKIMQIV